MQQGEGAEGECVFVLREFERVCRGGCKGTKDHVALTPYDPVCRPLGSQLHMRRCVLRWKGDVFQNAALTLASHIRRSAESRKERKPSTDTGSHFE